MLSEFCAAGLSQTHPDPIGNAHGLLPAGAGNPVVVSAHLDTVFPVDAHLPARREAGRLAAAGIGDETIGHAALAELALDLRSASLPAAIWYVGEEALATCAACAQWSTGSATGWQPIWSWRGWLCGRDFLR